MQNAFQKDFKFRVDSFNVRKVRQIKYIAVYGQILKPLINNIATTKNGDGNSKIKLSNKSFWRQFKVARLDCFEGIPPKFEY